MLTSVKLTLHVDTFRGAKGSLKTIGATARCVLWHVVHPSQVTNTAAPWEHTTHSLTVQCMFEGGALILLELKLTSLIIGPNLNLVLRPEFVEKEKKVNHQNAFSSTTFSLKKICLI